MGSLSGYMVKRHWPTLLIICLGASFFVQAGPPRVTPHPTLGFPKLGYSQILDEDAYLEEDKLRARLPKNQFVGMQRAMHEATLLQEFVAGFKDSSECHVITLYLTTNKAPEFTVHISVAGHDDHSSDQTWTWILFHRSNSSHDAEIGGLGTQSSAKLTAKDVCLTVWDDVDPNHFKKPGGSVK